MAAGALKQSDPGYWALVETFDQTLALLFGMAERLTPAIGGTPCELIVGRVKALDER